jgi:heptose-I-phosphate ethanolaminephosphotransferase
MIGNPYEREQRALIDFSLMKPKKPDNAVADATEQ